MVSIRRLNWATVRWRRVLQLLVALVALVVLFSATWSVIAIRTMAPRTTPGDFLAAFFGGGPAQGTLAQKLRQNGRVNLLFLARGGAGDDNPDYTDTMLVLSVRPGTHRATMISLP